MEPDWYEDGRAPDPAGGLRLSIVIACRNEAALLPTQLAALAAQDWAGWWEVIVADNGSTDGTPHVAGGWAGRISNLRIVNADERRGQAYARNVACRHAYGDAFCFLDADDEVAPGYLRATAMALAEHDLISARFDSDALNVGWVRASRQLTQIDDVQTGFGFLPYVGGGGLGMTRRVFEATGGFDERFSASHEDVDLCWRAQLAGFTLSFVPEATVRVRFRSSLATMFRQGRRYGRGEVLLYRRYRSAGMPGPSLHQSVDEWRRLGRDARRLRSRAQLGRWLRAAGKRVGRLEGSVRHAVLYL
jgi:GT2 family glycosyltransferase